MDPVCAKTFSWKNSFVSRLSVRKQKGSASILQYRPGHSSKYAGSRTEVLPTTGFFRPGGNRFLICTFQNWLNRCRREPDLTRTLDDPNFLDLRKASFHHSLPSRKLEVCAGSWLCRKPHGRDVMDLLSLPKSLRRFHRTYTIANPIARPLFFFHTGDQIYADDSSPFSFTLYRCRKLPYAGSWRTTFPFWFPKCSEAQRIKDWDFIWMQLTPEAFAPGKRATNFYSVSLVRKETSFSLANFSHAYISSGGDVLLGLPHCPKSMIF